MPPMTRRSEQLSEELHDYLVAHSAPPDAVLSQLAAETAAAFPAAAGMQIGPEQGTFMTLLTQLTGASRALEIGTFTGYSSICIARGLADGGKLTCCDVSEEWTSVARRYWELAGVADRIELQLRPAVETLRAMPAGETLRPCLHRRRQDRLCQLLGRGRAADPAGRGRSWWTTRCPTAGSSIRPSRTRTSPGIRAFNDHAAADDRVVLVLLPIGDGLTLARKK